MEPIGLSSENSCSACLVECPRFYHNCFLVFFHRTFLIDALHPIAFSWQMLARQPIIICGIDKAEVATNSSPTKKTFNWLQRFWNALASRRVSANVPYLVSINTSMAVWMTHCTSANNVADRSTPIELPVGSVVPWDAVSNDLASKASEPGQRIRSRESYSIRWKLLRFRLIEETRLQALGRPLPKNLKACHAAEILATLPPIDTTNSQHDDLSDENRQEILIRHLLAR